MDKQKKKASPSAQQAERKPEQFFCIRSFVASFMNKVDGVFEAGKVWDEAVLGVLPGTHKEKFFVPLSEKGNYRREGADSFRLKGGIE